MMLTEDNEEALKMLENDPKRFICEIWEATTASAAIYKEDSIVGLKMCF